MAWIKLIEEEEASDKLKKYCKHIKRTRGKIANILEVQSLTQSPKGSPRPLPSAHVQKIGSNPNSERNDCHGYFCHK